MSDRCDVGRPGASAVWPLAIALAFLGCRARSVEPDAEPHAAAASEGSALVLHLDADALPRVGVRLAAAEAGRLAPEVLAYGRVLDPAPANDAIASLAAARAAADAASRELARVEGLARGRQNASAREVEAARAAAARARADRDLADYRVDAVLGAARAELGDLSELARGLGRRRVALVRVDVSGGEERARPELGAHLTTAPQAGAELDARFLGPAPDVDPRRPGRGFLFLVTGAPPPGSPVRARLAAGGDELAGVRVPESALLRGDGRLYVFVALGEGRFERRAVTALPLPNGGAFATRGLAAGESVVVAGAQQLLSAQRLAAAGAEPAD